MVDERVAELSVLLQAHTTSHRDTAKHRDDTHGSEHSLIRHVATHALQVHTATGAHSALHGMGGREKHKEHGDLAHEKIRTSRLRQGAPTARGPLLNEERARKLPFIHGRHRALTHGRHDSTVVPTSYL